MSHAHEPASPGFGRTFAIGVGLNLGVTAEAYFGWRAGSLALIADAGHNLSDVGGLLLAWGAFSAARLRPDARHTYRWRRGSILAAFANAVILLFAMGTLAWEAVGRLQTPRSLDAVTVMSVAAAGAVVNAMIAWRLLARSRDRFRRHLSPSCCCSLPSTSRRSPRRHRAATCRSAVRGCYASRHGRPASFDQIKARRRRMHQN